jgi:hypothetical protein
MLDDDPTLVSFVDQMTRITRGRAFYVTSETLEQHLLVDYLRKKRVRVSKMMPPPIILYVSRADLPVAPRRNPG